jgi:large subunit ribosomal protein L18
MQTSNLLTALRKKNPKEATRFKRKLSVRKKVSGDAARPRLSVFRSARHIYAQVIDDTLGSTLAHASSLDADIRDAIKGQKKSDVAKAIGQAVAKRLIEKGVKAVVFDRNGYRYHGRIAAVAAGAREAGLEF